MPNRLSIRQVAVIYKRSAYDIYVREFHEAAVEAALAAGDPVAHRLLASHAAQQAALARVRSVLAARGVRARFRERRNGLRSTRSIDLVVTVGGDGTLLDTAHQVTDTTPVLGVNSDPERSTGQLCACTADSFEEVLDRLARGDQRPRPRTRIAARVAGEPVLGPCLNDLLFAHACPADVSRFEIAVMPEEAADERREGLVEIRSSGIWISTATGSTAAIRSAGGRPLPPRSHRIEYMVREPYVPPGRPASARGPGFVRPGEALVLVCRVRRGMLWADGPHRRCRVAYGQRVVVTAKAPPLWLVERPK